MRLFSILVCALLCASVILTSCSDSADTTGAKKTDSTGNHDSTVTSNDSSYGTANVTIDEYTKFIATNNFFCYDSRDSTIRLQVMGSVYKFFFVLPVPGLHAGTLEYKNLYNVGHITLSGPHSGSSGPITTTATIKLLINKLDLQTNQFSAMLSVHFTQPFGGFDSISSIIIENAGIMIYPNGSKASVTATFNNEPFSVSDDSHITATWNSSFTEDWQIAASQGVWPTGKGITISLSPTSEHLGNYDVPGRGNLFCFTDSTYSCTAGTLVVTSYDNARHIASGTFSGIMKNNLSDTKLSITNGEFKNIFLEP
jgi:hypothetical protein